MKYQGFRVEFDDEKNLLLKETRKICFEDVIIAIEKKKIVDDLKHPSTKHAHQRILVVKIANYAYAVPYVKDLERKVIFLKTVYPSRVMTSKYSKGGVKK